MLRIPVASLMALAVMAASATAVTAPNPQPCDDAYGKTIRANRSIRVFDEDIESQVFACRRPSGRPVLLGQEVEREGSSDGLRIDHLRIGSRFVAFSTVCDSGGNGSNAQVQVVDVISRRRAVVAALGGSPCILETQSSFYVSDVELRTSGSVAWVAEEYGPRSAGRFDGFSVGRFDRAGPALLDLSDQPISGLHLTGARIAWRRGGVERSAPID